MAAGRGGSARKSRKGEPAWPGGTPLRLAHNAPAQQRARDTLARIVTATERLLRKKSFEEITIAEIVEEAQTSTGSFYARFASKEALLPYLYEIYNTDASARPAAIEGTEGFAHASLARAAADFVGRAVSGVRQARWLLRAMSIYARTHPERVPKSALERSDLIYAASRVAFAPHTRGLGAEQAERRARFAAYAVVTLAREHELFGQAPLAGALGLSREEFEAELTRMTEAYLASERT